MLRRIAEVMDAIIFDSPPWSATSFLNAQKLGYALAPSFFGSSASRVRAILGSH